MKNRFDTDRSGFKEQLLGPRSLTAYRKVLPEYLHYYNHERPRLALKMQSPADVMRSY